MSTPSPARPTAPLSPPAVTTPPSASGASPVSSVGTPPVLIATSLLSADPYITASVATRCLCRSLFSAENTAHSCPASTSSHFALPSPLFCFLRLTSGRMCISYIPMSFLSRASSFPSLSTHALVRCPAFPSSVGYRAALRLHSPSWLAHLGT